MVLQRWVVGTAASLLLAVPSHASESEDEVDPEMLPFAGSAEWRADHEQRTKWFREARFGMMIHLGLYSAAGGYWPPDPANGRAFEQPQSERIRTWASVSEPDYGRALKPLFSPEPGCTEAWATLAKEAGMRYAVFTAKHHEGYTLFNSKAEYSAHNPVSGSTNISPPGRDLFREYADSFRRAGVVPGVYYSLIDWQYPDPARYRRYLHQHLAELASGYGPLGVLWVDYSSSGNEGAHWGTRSILDIWRTHQPGVVINNRFWSGLENPNGDFLTPDRYVPRGSYSGRLFEASHTLSRSFGYRHREDSWKSPAEVIRLLSEVASKGGNLLLNVGPDAKGRIPEPAVATLRAVGAWLQTHGEAIYGTTASPLPEPPFKGRITLSADGRPTTLYCHLNEWPEGGLLSIEGLETPCSSATLLGGGTVRVEQSKGGPPVIHLPTSPPDPDDPLPVVALRLDGTPVFDSSPYPRQAVDRSITLSATQAILAPSVTATNPMRLEESHIGFWSDTGESVWFPFVLRSPSAPGTQGPGKFDVYLDSAVGPDSGGEVEIRLLDQTIHHRLTPYDHWRDFRRVKVGTIALSQPGLMSLHVRPLSIQGIGLMNLRSIKLVPVVDE
ncbi:alpha-L-fucosidase [Luteolibacter arcticus]|uniref:alpha-L-fucosidase n=1 Tax=Luteolibacter arcticus TaxID=1581411 RepID=A0ABT3GPE2_9BACT|nr:alpha-L-fucosidase [Luteolibacter arcticus]MCW1925323.1 alpha-L-fucosidase [Luteolibacter arcticus]